MSNQGSALIGGTGMGEHQGYRPAFKSIQSGSYSPDHLPIG